MIRTLLALAFVFISFVFFGQQETTQEDPTEHVYTITFDASDVEDWSDFRNFITNITQAESLSLTNEESECEVHTYRVLDPKIISGKLSKYGVDFKNMEKK